MKISKAQKKTLFAIAGVTLLLGVVSVAFGFARSASRKSRLHQAIEDAEARARMDSEGGSMQPVEIH
jgi:hypothetical protein